MGKGRRYELAQKNAIIEATCDLVTAVRPDFSGNSKHSVADIRVTWQDIDGTLRDEYVEQKKRQGDAGMRTTVMSGSSNGGDESGLEELQRLMDGAPPWARAWVAIKFDHRRLCVFEAERLKYILTNGDDVDDHVFHPRLTPADNISMVKPTTDDWPSAQSSTDDHEALLARFGVPNDYLTEDN